MPLRYDMLLHFGSATISPAYRICNTANFYYLAYHTLPACFSRFPYAFDIDIDTEMRFHRRYIDSCQTTIHARAILLFAIVNALLFARRCRGDDAGPCDTTLRSPYSFTT